MSEISEKVIQDIEEKKIHPRPRWYFLMGRYSTFSLFVFSIVFGALSVATILFMLFDYDRDISQYFGRGLFKDILISIPYLWIVLFVFFILSADYNLRRTPRGYRFELHKIILLNLFLSILVGTGLFCFGFDSEIDDLVSRNVPFYENLIYNKDDIWVFPEKGLLSGEVIQIIGPGSFTLRDFHGYVWRVNEEGLDPSDFRYIHEGAKLKLIGEQTGEGIFDVKIICSWQECCGVR
ncbi:MAG: hypothetical protein WC845_02675 [Candidatus Staskawiczbacteria bacterium]|jgi:hypothetical protein